MAEKTAIDLLLEEEEAAQKAAEAAQAAAPAQNAGYLSQIFPSSKNMRVGTASDIWPSSWGQFAGNAKNALRLTGEALTYPIRGIGGAINAAAGNTRGGDYGIGETFEESGKGYNEYNFPMLGKFSPMGFVQGITHDPLNAASGPIGKAARPALSLWGKLFRGAGTNMAQEAARPLAMDVEDDHYMDILSAGAMGAGTSAAGAGLKRAIGNLGMIKSKLSPEQYNDLLLRLARKNHVKPEILEEAVSADARAKMRQNYKQEANIASDIIEYKNFDEAKFPENKTFHEFLDRSEATVTPENAVRNLTEYGQRTREAAGGGGLTSVESAIEKRLPREAEIFYEQKSAAPAPGNAFEAKIDKPVLFNAEGQQMARSENPPRKIREMNAKELNNARQRIGKLLEDDFKREALGRPDDEVKALKNAYFSTRQSIMDIMNKEGETAAMEAYKTMGEKLGSREALFEALSVPANKYKAQDALTRRLPNIYQNEKKTGLWGRFNDFDDKFGTNFSERVKWNNIANQLGEGTGAHDFKLKGDNNWFTGKGWRSPLAKISDRWTGGTVDAAARKLEAAKADNPGFQFGFGSFGDYMPRIYSRPEAAYMSAVQEHGESSPEAQALYNAMPIGGKNRVIEWLNGVE